MTNLDCEWVPIELFIPVIDTYLACDKTPALIAAWSITKITDHTSGDERKIFWWLVGILAGYHVRVIF